MKYFIYFIAFLLIINFLILQIPTFSNNWEYNDDYRMHIYWMQKFNNPALFNNDLFSDYSEYFQPFGVTALYWVGAKTIGLFETAKLLQVILIFLTCLFTYLIFKEIFNDGFYEKYFGLFLLIILPGYYQVLFGAYSRGFGFFLMTANIYFLIKEKYNIVGFNLILCALFHPPSFLICTSYLAVTFLLKFLKNKSYKIPFILIIFFLLASGLIFIKYIPENEKIGNIISYDRNMPEFQNNGRAHISEIKNIFQTLRDDIKKTFDTGTSVRNLSRHKISNYDYVLLGKNISQLDNIAHFFNRYILTYLSIIGIIYFFVFNKKVNNEIKNKLILFFCCSILLFFIADFLALKLYFPSRYLRPIVQLLSIVGMINILILCINYKLKKNRNLLFLLICYLFLFFHGTGFRFSQGMNINVSSNYKILEFIKTLPEDSLIAANPAVSDNIPLFTGRKVLFDREHFLPFYDKYYSKVKVRGLDFFVLYYSRDLNTVKSIVNKYKINFLVIKKSDFNKDSLEEKKIFYEPLNKKIKEIIDNQKGKFAWEELLEYKVYEDEFFVILKLL